MENHIVKVSGTYDEIFVLCPSCGSSNITISVDEKGYYGVIACHKCGYSKKPLED